MAGVAVLGVIVLLQLLLIAMLVSYIVCTVAALMSDYTDVPFVPTPRNAYQAIVEALELRPTDIVYELGSGLGGFLLYAARQNRGAKYIGIERNRLLLLLSQINKRIAGNPENVEFRRGDFLTIDFSNATKAYGYLLHSVMNRLLPQMQKQFHGIFVSRAFTFREKPPARVIELAKKPGLHGQNRLYVYDF